MLKAKRRVSSRTVRLEQDEFVRQLRDQLQLQFGKPRPPRPPAPTFAECFERFLTWSRANRQKPATLFTKESLWRVHLEARLGKKPIDELQLADVEALKASLRELSAKRLNTLLSVLRKMLKLAVERGELEQLPCPISAVKETRPEFEYYDYATYDRLVAGAAGVGLAELLVVLLGGDAGLRMGEMLGLQRGDVDLVHGVLRVRRSLSLEQLVAPKGGRGRVVKLTRLLRDVLAELFSRGRAPRSNSPVLVDERRQRLTVERIRTRMRRAQRAGGLEATGNLHVLRHTFCSHLAMQGASTVSIKELAGHESISTTERYMHLADAEKQRAIALLDGRRRRPDQRSAETVPASQRSEAIGLSPGRRSNTGRRSPAVNTGGGGTDRCSALTPRRFELLGQSNESQLEWLDYLLAR